MVLQLSCKGSSGLAIKTPSNQHVPHFCGTRTDLKKGWLKEVLSDTNTIRERHIA
jgi:hypothetical protein